MNRRQAITIALFGCLVLALAWFDAHSSQITAPPKPTETAEKANKKSAYNNPFELFWNWTTNDAVSFYTFVLAIFTGVVGVTAIVQIRYLRRADETARITAEAAKKSADVAESGQRQIGEQVEVLRQSADAAVRSEIATRDLVRTTRDNAQLELRAYIGIEWTRIYSYDGGNTFRVEVQIKNTGETPAFRVTHCITSQIFQKIQPLNLRMPNRNPGNLPIAPGMNFLLRTPVVIGVAGGTGFIDTGQKFIIAWGKVDYFDFFGFPRYLTFRFRSADPIREMVGDTMRTVGWRMDAEDEGNDAT